MDFGAGLGGHVGAADGQAIPDQLPMAAQAVLAALDCDLVEAEDRDPLWLSTIRDLPNAGPVRPEIETIIAAHRADMPAKEVHYG